MLEKDNTIKELKSTIEIFELKISKMEQLIKIKDNKIQSLVTKLQQAGVNWILFIVFFLWFCIFWVKKDYCRLFK